MSPPPGPPAPDCSWEQDLQRAGVTEERPAGLRYGTPFLSLAMLAAAAVTAVLSGDPGVAGLALLAVAAVPWLVWLRADNGPTWTFAAATLTPLAVLGIGQEFTGALSLGGEVAYRLATFPVLLVVLLTIASGSTRIAVGTTIAGYAAFGVPLFWGDATIGVTWHMGFAFCVAAGYAVKLTYIATAKIAEARQALAAQAAAEQRRRVAQDVHDVVAHTLAVTMLHITAARMAVRRSSPAEAEEALEEAERHGRSSLADIRRIVRFLRSDEVTAVDAAQPGLDDIEALVDSYRAAGHPVRLSLAIDERCSSPAAELAVYRVLQEALANAARHGSGPATVTLRVADGGMSLQVGNPVGQRAAGPSQGSGLIGMRERVAAAGGVIETGARDGRWLVQASLPIEAAA
ncbi:histidine kinase [Streptosporangium soli]|nr:histidine kinase [Streptosporangium sp. KLBMP 9127]